eukprot:1142127-Pelagomonas_calceolata.AAC.3
MVNSTSLQKHLPPGWYTAGHRGSMHSPLHSHRSRRAIPRLVSITLSQQRSSMHKTLPPSPTAHTGRSPGWCASHCHSNAAACANLSPLHPPLTQGDSQVGAHRIVTAAQQCTQHAAQKPSAHAGHLPPCLTVTLSQPLRPDQCPCRSIAVAGSSSCCCLAAAAAGPRSLGAACTFTCCDEKSRGMHSSEMMETMETKEIK